MFVIDIQMINLSAAKFLKDDSLPSGADVQNGFILQLVYGNVETLQFRLNSAPVFLQGLLVIGVNMAMNMFGIKCGHRLIWGHSTIR